MPPQHKAVTDWTTMIIYRVLGTHGDNRVLKTNTLLCIGYKWVMPRSWEQYILHQVGVTLN